MPPLIDYMEPSTAPSKSNNIEPAFVELEFMVISENDLSEGDESQFTEELIDEKKIDSTVMRLLEGL